MNQKKRTKFFITFIEPHYLGVYHFILGQVKNKELAEDLTQLTMEHA